MSFVDIVFLFEIHSSLLGVSHIPIEVSGSFNPEVLVCNPKVSAVYPRDLALNPKVFPIYPRVYKPRQIPHCVLDSHTRKESILEG